MAFLRWNKNVLVPETLNMIIGKVCPEETVKENNNVIAQDTG